MRKNSMGNCVMALGLGMVTLPNAIFAQEIKPFFTGLNSIEHSRIARNEIENNEEIQDLLKDHNHHNLILSQQLNSNEPASGVETLKFQHYYNGIQVIGSMAFHHMSTQGTAIRNHISRFDLDTEPSISQESAASLAQAAGGDASLNSLPTLRILPRTDRGSAQLIYWIELKGKGLDGGQDILINAHSGKIIAQLSHQFTIAPIEVYNAKKRGRKLTPRVTHDPETGNISLKGCKLENIETGESKSVTLSTCKAIYAGISSLTQDQCQVINGLDGFPIEVNPERCTPAAKNDSLLDTEDSAAARALDNSKKVLEYYSQHFNRESFDGKGSPLISVIHAGDGMNNAFWTTEKNLMVYGDRDDQQVGDFTQAVDVAGHEMTHGVIAKTSQLMMMGESGALNEAFSDFFGKMIENKEDWVIGRQLFSNSDGPLGIRDLAQPSNLKGTLLDAEGHIFKKPYPATRQEQVQVAEDTPCDSRNDGCYVHYNSTIPGHASYLIYNALGSRKAELLLYTTLTQNLTETDNFKSAAQAIIQTCEQLHFTTDDCEKVKSVYSDTGLL